MSLPNIVGVMKREAREQSQMRSKVMEEPTTGEVVLGPVRVHYFPACDQFAFWIYGKKTTQEFLAKWCFLSTSRRHR
jgi:hypothetical protein